MCTCLALPDVPISERGHAVCFAYSMAPQSTYSSSGLARKLAKTVADGCWSSLRGMERSGMTRQSTGRRRGSLRKLAKTDAKTNDVDCCASFAKTDTSLDEGTGAVVIARNGAERNDAAIHRQQCGPLHYRNCPSYRSCSGFRYFFKIAGNLLKQNIKFCFSSLAILFTHATLAAKGGQKTNSMSLEPVSQTDLHTFTLTTNKFFVYSVKGSSWWSRFLENTLKRRPFTPQQLLNLTTFFIQK